MASDIATVSSAASTAVSPTPLVGICLLNYCGYAKTIACLESIKGLRYLNRLTVLVDNGSPDGSGARLRDERPDLDITLLPANTGFAGGVNVAIRRALDLGCEMVWVLNNDTVLDPQALTALTEAILSSDQIGMAGSILRHMSEPEDIQAFGGGTILWLSGRAASIKSTAELKRMKFLCGASLLIRRETLQDVGLFDERFFFYWEDVDLSLRIQQAGWRLIVAEQSVVYHQVGGTAGSGSLWSERQELLSLGKFLRKHSRLWPITLTVRLAGACLNRLRRRQFVRIFPLISATLSGLRRHNRD